jgi:hypothetical protein
VGSRPTRRIRRSTTYARAWLLARAATSNSFTEEGRELVAILEAAHREGVQAYVAGLEASERDQLEEALGPVMRET